MKYTSNFYDANVKHKISIDLFIFRALYLINISNNLLPFDGTFGDLPTLALVYRGVLNTEHARMSARSVHILGCSKSSIPELLQYEHVRARSVPEPCCSWAQDPKKPHPNIPKLGQKYFVMLYKIWIFYTKLKQCGNW